MTQYERIARFEVMLKLRDRRRHRQIGLLLASILGLACGVCAVYLGRG